MDVAQVKGSGDKGRVTKDDVQNFVKAALAQPRGAAGGNGLQVLAMPVVDFAKFGAIETRPLSRIKKISGANLHRNWVTIPHVTQYDEADITEMEAFRKQLGEEYAKQNIKITPLAFMLKAAVAALQEVSGVQCVAGCQRRESGAQTILPYRRRGGYAGRPDGAGAARRGQEGHRAARQGTW